MDKNHNTFAIYKKIKINLRFGRTNNINTLYNNTRKIIENKRKNYKSGKHT